MNPIVTVLAMLGAGLAGGLAGGGASAQLKAGDPAPSFTLPGSDGKSHALAGRHRTSISARRDLAEAREEAIRAAAKTLRQHVVPALEESGIHIADCLRGDDYVDAALFRELARLVRQIAPPNPRKVTFLGLSGVCRLAACKVRAAAVAAYRDAGTAPQAPPGPKGTVRG